ncbi:MAG: hypothetical protein J2P29_11300, partial [Actinobacteria bacterium]|nr:hypothetical protein [Actinomycetota bacterium]
AMPDGRGDVVLVDYGGAIYDVGPRLLRPVGGVPVAVGPTNWLAVKCAGGACHDLVIDPVTGASRALPGQPVTETPWTYSLGVVAPSGAIAAVVVPGIRDGTGTLELINLATGTKTRVDVPVGDPADRQLAWSPDGQWLFAVTSRGTLAAISMRTGRVQNLRLGMSGLSQIAIRPAPG